jgi:adenylate cyclase
METAEAAAIKPISRRLCAILSADVAGCSARVETVEAGTIEAVRAVQSEIFAPTVAHQGGRPFKTMGDGMLYEFASIVAALEAAIAIQTAIADGQAGGLRFRIGVHLGDVILEGDNLLGDGVNIAVRIEAKAAPGGVALPDEAFRRIKTKTKARWRDGGETALKKISTPVRIWHRAPEGTASAARKPPVEDVPVKPAIAVLPFQDLSGDGAQEFLADGLVQDVTSELSRYTQLLVSSRSSAFSLKGRNLDVRRIAQELGVGYVLEGSVRRAGQRLRVTAQSIEAGADTHIRAHRFDRTVDDLFDIRDEITTSVVGIVIDGIERAETTRASRKRVNDLTAWERLMKRLWHLERGTAEDNVRSQEIFRSETRQADGRA